MNLFNHLPPSIQYFSNNSSVQNQNIFKKPPSSQPLINLQAQSPSTISSTQFSKTSSQTAPSVPTSFPKTSVPLAPTSPLISTPSDTVQDKIAIQAPTYISRPSLAQSSHQHNYNQSSPRKKRKIYIAKDAIVRIVKEQLQSILSNGSFPSHPLLKQNLSITPTCQMTLCPPPFLSPQTSLEHQALKVANNQAKRQKRKKNKQKKKLADEQMSYQKQQEADLKLKLIEEIQTLVENLPDHWKNNYRMKTSPSLKHWDSFNLSIQLRTLKLDIEDYQDEINPRGYFADDYDLDPDPEPDESIYEIAKR